LALLHINLPEINICSDIARVNFQHTFKGRYGFFGLILVFGNQPENIMRLRIFGRNSGCRLCFFQSSFNFLGVEKRDGKIDSRNCEVWIEFERPPKCFRAFFIIELFKLRNADIVCAISLFAFSKRYLIGRLCENSWLIVQN